MSLFGKLDAAAIPTNPFYVEEGDYKAEVTRAEYRTNRDNKKQLLIEYTINNEDSQFLDSKVQQFFTLMDPEMTTEAFALLPADDQKSIRRTNSAIKRTLCGNDNNSAQKGLGVPIDDLNDPDWNPAVLVGTKVDIGISNYGSSKEGVNVKWVNLAD